MRFLALALLIFLPVALAQKSLGRFGGFEVAELVDPITDVRTVGAIVQSSQGRASLGIRCVGDRFDVLIGGTPWTNAVEKEIFARFDQGLVRETWATVSFDGDAIRLKSQDLLWFYSRALISRQFAVRVYERNGAPSTYVFNMAGFSQADKLLTCPKPR